MSKRKEAKRKAAQQTPLLLEPVRRVFAGQIVLALFVAIILLIVAWSKARACGDFFVGLAGGRDIIDTRLKCLFQPDTWSFNTTDKMWFNQNWGTHIIFYLTWIAGGEWGELLLKAAVMTLMAFAIAMRCREMKVDWPIAILVGATAVAAGKEFIDMRPNLMTLMIAPVFVWLLLRTRAGKHRAWVALAVMIAWSNIHGGFVFGLAMFGLWTLCWAVAEVFKRGIEGSLRANWPLIAALLAGIVLAATLTPYGHKNLTHVLKVGGSAEWRGISEWRPIHIGDFGSAWEFLAVVGTIVGLSVLSPLIHLMLWKTRRVQLTVEHLVRLVFSLCLCAVLLVLTLNIEPIEIFKVHYDTILCVTILVLLIGAPVGLAILVGLGKGFRRWMEAHVKPATHGDLAALVFELVLAVVVIAMAIKARRFIPLAIVLIAPIAAVQIEWVYRLIGRAWVIIIPAVALLVPALLFAAPTIYLRYHPNNPLIPKLSTFERMLACRNYPYGGTQFLIDNDIGGRVFHDWRWEGFLRWRVPQLRLFVGGRAQQVYDIETFNLGQRILGRAEHRTLSRMGVHLVAIPDRKSEPAYHNMIKQMVYGPKARWACIYWNDRKTILADASSPDTRKLIERAARGELKYPTPEIAALSRAVCLLSPIVDADVDTIVQAFKHANDLRPTLFAYTKLWDLNANQRLSSSAFIAYLEKEHERLKTIPTTGSDGLTILRCRDVVASMLYSLSGRVGRTKEAQKWEQARIQVRVELNAMAAQWR